MSHSSLRHVPIGRSLFGISLVILGVVSSSVFAKNFNLLLTVNPGTLAIDIVDASYVTVGSPSFSLDPVATSFSCQSTSGDLGTTTQKIYIQNPDAADNGWSVTLAGSTPTSSWTGTGANMDFNDPTTAGCTDGADLDTYKGQLSLDPSVATLAVGQCASCATTSITKGSSSAFNQGTVDSVTLLTGAAGSNDFGDWTLLGVDVSQTIPAEQVATNDYSLPMVLSVVAS